MFWQAKEGHVIAMDWCEGFAKLVKDRDALLTFYDFPAKHWKHIRTSNPIESTFATVRHRTKRTKGCLSRKTGLAMAFSRLDAAGVSLLQIRDLLVHADVSTTQKYASGEKRAAVDAAKKVMWV